MRFDVVTLFPDLFGPHLTQGITRRAFESGAVDVQLWPLRDFADNVYRRVDDRPFGGGPGMVMLAEPLWRALEAVRDARAALGLPSAPVVHFTPTGQPLTQPVVERLASSTGAVLLCGRYEGIDQRVLDHWVTEEISLGDFILSGGELPALVLIDAVARLQPGVMAPASHQLESFADGLLEAPCYSRPEQIDTPDGVLQVPAVLCSGHHAAIARWRREESLRLTAQRRPDLLALARAQGRLDAEDEAFLKRSGL
jgi:tRNA (guanine37-N1)-methyltransferase